MYTIRQLKQKDFKNGFFETLEALSPEGRPSLKNAKRVLRGMKGQGTRVFVLCNKQEKVLASATIYFEPKFMHDGGLVGHIENVCVIKGCQEYHLGSEIVEACLKIIENVGCYKAVITCERKIRNFYGREGFQEEGSFMTKHFEKKENNKDD